MKKLFSMLAFFMMAMCVLTLSSCGDDAENESKANTAEILGSWEETTVKSGENSTVEVITTWTFNANKTATEKVEAYTTTVYTDKTKLVSLTFDFTYEYNGKTMKLTSTDPTVKEPVSYYTVEISGNKMRMGNEKDGYFNLTKK